MKMGSNGPYTNGNTKASSYSVLGGCRQATSALQGLAADQLLPEFTEHLKDVTYTTSGDGTQIYFPCPFKETEATVALKSLEASIVAATANLRYPDQPRKRKIEINLERTATFLFSTYVATVGGLGKQDPGVKAKLKDTDLLKAQAILYRRLSANLYETKTPGEYYHIHGSLEAGKTLNMIGLESHRPDLTDYTECLDVIEAAVKNFTVEELEVMNARERQAGVPALKWEDFRETSHGKALLSIPPYQVTSLETSSPPAPFPPSPPSTTSLPQPLAGIRVLEICRIIAGPAMGRTLAQYGASVLKITSPNLSDVPFFQVDANTGKHTCNIDLKTPSGRAAFENLLLTTDVILDGYRPGALSKLGYSPSHLVRLAKREGREKGLVYVAEDCFGPLGPWSGRPGWQQIADCVTGVAWKQGIFMGRNEPVVPPFPMSDYGTGCLGAIAALTGLYKRATEGGSWVGRTSLCQYDVFLLGLDLYGDTTQDQIRWTFKDGEKVGEEGGESFFGLRHRDSVDEVGRRALKVMKSVNPGLFAEANMQGAWSEGFGAEVRWCRDPVGVEGVRVGFERATRPNGWDEVGWEGWEVDGGVA